MCHLATNMLTFTQYNVLLRTLLKYEKYSAVVQLSLTQETGNKLGNDRMYDSIYKFSSTAIMYLNLSYSIPSLGKISPLFVNVITKRLF